VGPSKIKLLQIYISVKAAAHALIREAMEDTVLTVPNPLGEEGSQTIHIPKGTEVRPLFLRLHPS
jgi:hypothetical protein